VSKDKIKPTDICRKTIPTVWSGISEGSISRVRRFVNAKSTSDDDADDDDDSDCVAADRATRGCNSGR